MQNRARRCCFIGMRGVFALAFLVASAHAVYTSKPNLYELAGKSPDDLRDHQFQRRAAIELPEPGAVARIPGG